MIGMDQATQREVPSWRRKCYQGGRLLVLLNPLYFLISISFGGWLHMSDEIWGSLILVGVWLGWFLSFSEFLQVRLRVG